MIRVLTEIGVFGSREGELVKLRTHWHQACGCKLVMYSSKKLEEYF